MPIKLGTANTPSRRNMPIEQIDRVKAQHGWTVPFYSSLGTSFSDDSVVGGGFLLNALLRDGDEVYRTYTTGSRGVDRLMFVNNIQDLSVYGRQEDWEDSPEGWPQWRPTADGVGEVVHVAVRGRWPSPAYSTRQ